MSLYKMMDKTIDYNQPTITCIKLTPRKAKKFISTYHNRYRLDHYDREIVKRFVKSMKNGNWKHPTNSCIAFDMNNKMIDGLHRCLAVVKSGVTIQVAFVQNIKPQIYL